MATASSALSHIQTACVTCMSSGQRFIGRYRAFLLNSGTIFTLVSFLLLVSAVIMTPDGLVNSTYAHTWLYLAAALIGSVSIWWSALQGIREGDFTADIPVSLATAAALIIGQYSAAAVVAVLLLLGGMLEAFVSEHPLGRAVLQMAIARDIGVSDPEEFTVLPGLGVRARIQGADVVIGRPQLLSEQGILVTEEASILATNLTTVGRTVILVAANREMAGMLVLEDMVRPEASQVIARLKKLGIRTVLVTGDNTVTAERLAEELGIIEVHAEVLPAQKMEIVKHLQTEGHHVAFVGDGVNDGPALATANVGVAMGLGGTDVAIETAEITLLSDDLARLPHLLSLSRQAIRAIKQNVIFSLGVLAMAVGLASIGVLSPVMGALLHELSSIPVIINSARLIGLCDHDDV